MTRINVGVGPRELPDKMLLAEHREITRIPNAIKKGRTKNFDNLPPTFCLGTGHVRFFYDKLRYLAIRYSAIHAECRRRGFNVTDKTTAFHSLPAQLMGNYIPTETDRALIVARIESKGHTLIFPHTQLTAGRPLRSIARSPR